MISKLRDWWSGEVVRAVLMVPVAMAGVALPLDFIAQIDSYLKYLQPIELPLVYAWGWLFFVLFGFALAMVTVLAATVVAKLFRLSPTLWGARVGYWLSLSIMTFALLKGTKLWIEINGFALADFVPRIRWLGVAAIVGSAVWVWRRATYPEGLMQTARLGAIGGLILAVASPLAALTATAPARVLTVAADVEKVVNRPPNIILITIDAFAANHASLYGYSRATTPNLERLAGQASVFERFYANSNFTTSTVSSIVHGVRPWTHRALHIRARPNVGVVEFGLVPIIRNAGYYTSAVATNPWAAPFHNLSAQWFHRAVYGRAHFPHFQDYIAHFPYAASPCDMWMMEYLFQIADRLLQFVSVNFSAKHFDPELAFSVARSIIAERDQARPIFVWVHLFPPHGPYATPEPFIGQFDSSSFARTTFDSEPPGEFLAGADGNFPDRYVGRYDESVLYIDYHVGQFISWLKTQGLFDEALLMISADHGESFVKGYGAHGGPMMHDALIHIPLLIKEPGQSVGKRLDVLAEQIDLMPTILDLAGVSANVPVQGRSLKPAIHGQRMEGAVFSMNFEQSSRFGELNTGSVAMIEGRWKYVHYRGKPKYPLMPKLEDSLYDLQADPEENTNLITAHPAIATKMLAVIQDQLRRHGRPVK